MNRVAQVAVVMGSRSDWETMHHAVEILKQLEINCHVQIVSAHRTPDLLFQFAENAINQKFKVIIAGAGGAAHLPGMLAAKTVLPIIGVPIQSNFMNGLDSLLSIVQMPKGVPVATVSVGKAGAKNAGLLAASILGSNDKKIQASLLEFRNQQTEEVMQNLQLTGGDVCA